MSYEFLRDGICGSIWSDVPVTLESSSDPSFNDQQLSHIWEEERATLSENVVAPQQDQIDLRRQHHNPNHDEIFQHEDIESWKGDMITNDDLQLSEIPHEICVAIQSHLWSFDEDDLKNEVGNIVLKDTNLASKQNVVPVHATKATDVPNINSFLSDHQRMRNEVDEPSLVGLAFLEAVALDENGDDNRSSLSMDSFVVGLTKGGHSKERINGLIVDSATVPPPPPSSTELSLMISPLKASILDSAQLSYQTPLHSVESSQFADKPNQQQSTATHDSVHAASLLCADERWTSSSAFGFPLNFFRSTNCQGNHQSLLDTSEDSSVCSIGLSSPPNAPAKGYALIHQPRTESIVPEHCDVSHKPNEIEPAHTFSTTRTLLSRKRHKGEELATYPCISTPQVAIKQLASSSHSIAVTDVNTVPTMTTASSRSNVSISTAR
jgi:hypothetical protein